MHRPPLCQIQKPALRVALLCWAFCGFHSAQGATPVGSATVNVIGNYILLDGVAIMTMDQWNQLIGQSGDYANNQPVAGENNVGTGDGAPSSRIWYWKITLVNSNSYKTTNRTQVFENSVSNFTANITPQATYQVTGSAETQFTANASIDGAIAVAINAGIKKVVTFSESYNITIPAETKITMKIYGEYWKRNTTEKLECIGLTIPLTTRTGNIDQVQSKATEFHEIKL